MLLADLDTTVERITQRGRGHVPDVVVSYVALDTITAPPQVSELMVSRATR